MLRFFISILFLSSIARAQMIPFAFLGPHGNRLIFSTSSQSITADVCSSLMTVQTQNPSGNPITVASNLTITLSAPTGVTFYSDSACTNLITSVVILSGNSSASFYFTSAPTGAKTVSASATAYSAASQAETVIANSYVWTGNGANANWGTSANWSGGSVPGSGNIAYFDGTCVSNCSPNMNANISVYGVSIGANFAGTITQSSGVSVSLGAAGWIQIAGTFVGGNTNMDVPGNFTLTGGSFTAPTATLYIRGSSSGSGASISNPSYFHNNSGTVSFGSQQYGDGHVGVDFNNVDLYNVILARYNTDRGLAFYSVPNARGTLTFNEGAATEGSAINAYGNVVVTQNGGSSNRTATTINIVGNSNQTITGAGTSNPIDSININKSGGTLSLSGTISFDANFQYTAGTVNAGTSTVCFGTGNYGDTSGIITTGSALHFNNVSFNPYSNYRSYGLGAALYVDGNITFGGSNGNIYGSYPIIIAGNLTYNSDFSANSSVATSFTGSNAQTIQAASGASPPTGTITVSKSGGSLTLASNFSLASGSQTFVVSSGNVSMSGYNFNIPGSLSLNNNTLTKGGGTLTVGGSTAGTGALYGGTVAP